MTINLSGPLTAGLGTDYTRDAMHFPGVAHLARSIILVQIIFLFFIYTIKMKHMDIFWLPNENWDSGYVMNSNTIAFLLLKYSQ